MARRPVPPRSAFVYIEALPIALERLARPELRERPLVIGGAAGEPQEVRAASHEARAFGIQEGMPLRHAIARCPDLLVLPPRHVHYREAGERFSRALATLSPLVEPADLGQAWLGLEGCDSLPGGERALVAAIDQQVATALQLAPQIGVANGKFTARVAALLAEPGRPRFIDRRGSAALLAPLPVGYLPIDPETHRRLLAFGIRTIGQVAALPFATLQAQFGRLGARIWQLARGADFAPIRPHPFVPELTERFEFDTPNVTLDLIRQAARHVLNRLVTRPDFGSRVARGLRFCAHLDGGRLWERHVTFREPIADPGRMLLALSAKLAAFPLDLPVETISITLRGLCAEAGPQLQLPIIGRTSQGERVKEVIDQLRERYARVPISQIVEVEPWSRIPERRFALITYNP
jgi:DNA polymerase-4/protein ImuB